MRYGGSLAILIRNTGVLAHVMRQHLSIELENMNSVNEGSIARVPLLSLRGEEGRMHSRSELLCWQRWPRKKSSIHLPLFLSSYSGDKQENYNIKHNP